jgi:hypothetical protein
VSAAAQRRKLSASDLRLLAILVFCALLFPSAAYTQFRNHRPPWDDPVASTRTIQAGGASIQIDFGPGAVNLPQENILHWIDNAVLAVTTYYGRFPVPRDRILVEFVPGNSGVENGTTWGGVGGFPAFTRIHVGQLSTQQDLDTDWMMTHELIHTAFPSMADEHHWIEEGISVYVEPVARVQAGLLKPEKIWNDMVRDMPKGDPQSFDRGLDNTHTWGRTYWGGAQFCLMADINIRKQTNNRKGLQDALKAIVNAGGTIDQDWPITRAFTIGDQATGTHVLMDMYNQMSDAPKAIDLDALWKELGVERTADGVRFDNNAPLAKIRLAITASPKSRIENAAGGQR